MKAKVTPLVKWVLATGCALLLYGALLLPGRSAGEAKAALPGARDDQISPRNADTTWLVNTLADSGPGSLREALAGAAAGDRIEFDAAVFPPEAPGVIAVLSELPHISVNDLTIDAVGRGVILDGSNLPPDITKGLILHANNSTIQGLQVQGFHQDGIVLNGAKNSLIGGDRLTGEGNVIGDNGWAGIRLSGTATYNNVIAGNIVGADASGMVAMPNGENGIRVESGAHDNTIGGLLAGHGNLISGNAGSGIVILGPGSDRNLIQGNLIGTDLTGEGLLGNGTGINIDQGPNDTLVGGDTVEARNIVAGSGGAGILISGISTDDTKVRGNYIGLNSSGTLPLPNGEGVLIMSAAKRSSVGGDSPDRRNVISGNGGTGIAIHGSATTGSVIQGNYIGTDPSGTEAIPNLGHGVALSDNRGSLIGGTGNHESCAGACNLISGNLGAGVVAQGSLASENTIQGNYLGSDWTGELALGNGRQGIRIDVQANNNDVGGESPGAGNLIRFNNEGGVALSAFTSANLLTGNRIEDNQGVAIRYRPGNTLGVNACKGNELNLVEVSAGTLAGGGEVWQPQGDLTRFVVVAAGQAPLWVPAASTWTVGAGAEVLFDFGLEAVIEGHLEAQGTADQPVVFGSAQRYAAPLAGDWRGLTFKPGSSGSLEYSAVEFAQTGLSLEGAAVSLSDSTVTASQLDGIFAGAGSSLSLANNTVAGNGRFGLNNQTSTPVNAAGTWWGHASGPESLGDAVSGNVDYGGWRTDPGFNGSWKYAAVLNPGPHTFAISGYRDLDWFRLP
jgi:hypothetical protein